MALDVEPQRHNSTALILVGGLLLAAAGFLTYTIYGSGNDGQAMHSAQREYKLTQRLQPRVEYMDNSFFGGSAGDNNAYVTALTKAIQAQYQYRFEAPGASDVSYRYEAVATVSALYAEGDKSDFGGRSSVWRRVDRLVEPKAQPAPSNTSFSISPTIDIPFLEYRQEMERFNEALDLSLGSEVTVTVTVTVQGVIDGSDFSDTQTATLTVPLGQQLYTINTNLEKEHIGFVGPSGITTVDDIRQYLPQLIAIAVAATGVVCIFFGLRRRVGGTPYQRELDRIYRYHDGIIIRTNKVAKLADKSVVEVDSFDDMLNLQEELNVPIIATYAGPEATRFMAIHSDVAYVYTLGTVRRTASAKLDDDADIEAIVAKAARRPKKPARKTATKSAAKKK